MSPSPMVAGFLAGLITMSYAAIALCFFRFWRLRRDPLLGAFAVAFSLLATHHAIFGLFPVPRESRSLVYLLRVAAFAVIAIAILRKNLGHRPTGMRRSEDSAAADAPGPRNWP